MKSTHRVLRHLQTGLPETDACQTRSSGKGRLASLFLLLFLSLFPLASLSAFAQAPEIGGLLPSGGPRGQSTRVQIEGKNLAGASLHFSGTGIAIKTIQVAPAGDRLTADLTVESGTRLGPQEIRITTPKGVSNGARFWVDVYPNQVIEQPMQESNPPVTIEGANPVVINSRIPTRAGRDRFTFNAAAGETWVFDCFTDRIRSRMDAVMELRDEKGVSLRLVQSMWESDPRFCYTFPKSGRYFLTVRDSEYNGGSNYTYRMLAGKMPFVTSVSPHGGQPGRTVTLALQGKGLTTNRASVLLPPDALPGNFWVEVPASSDRSVVVPLIVSSEPVMDAGESSVTRPLPSLPVAVDGTFAHTSRARFTFHAVAKAKMLFDLLGRRIGSRIDGEIRILDAMGKEIAANDDAPELGKEARLEFTAPVEGDYTVEVRNVEEITGSDCYYRLKVRPVVPDFRLSIATDRLAVPRAGTLPLTVNVERLGGFEGPVDVHIEELPAGVVSKSATIPAGKPSVDITLTATPDAVLSATAIHVLGKATIGKRSVVHEAPAWERYEHRSIDLVLSVEYNYARPFHLWQMLLLAVTEAVPAKK